MTVLAFRSLFKEQLQDIYEASEISSFEKLAFAKIANVTPSYLVLNAEEELDQNHLSQLREVIQRLQKEEPIQYILGDTEFYGLPFIVTPATLVPRPETEELVDWILKEVSKQRHIEILDIGTGSGCIAISLKSNLPLAGVTAYDLSNEALEVANQNAINNKVDVLLEQLDILEASELNQKFDCIVSNPPYVRVQEQSQIKANVLDYEPHQALFVADDDALIFYKKIGELALNHLTNQGLLFFEINQYLGKQTKTLLETIGFNKVTLKKDLQGNDRMILARM